MKVRNIKASDAYTRGNNKFIIEKGGKNIQITAVELLQLKRRQLNEFILHSVSNNEERVAVCEHEWRSPSHAHSICRKCGFIDSDC